MYTKRYLYSPCRRCCIQLLTGGFVGAFEESLSVVQEGQSASDTARKKDIAEDPQRMERLVSALRKAEAEDRAGNPEGSFRARMDLASVFAEEEDEGWRWVVDCVNAACLTRGRGLEAEVLHRMAEGEEERGNVDVACHYLERALKVDPGLQAVSESLVRVYRLRGEECLSRGQEKEGILYCKKAAKLARDSGASVESQALCHALLGRALLKINDTKGALKNLEKYLELSEGDPVHRCDALLSLCEVRRRTGQVEEAKEAAEKCRQEATESELVAVASLALGQLETATGGFLSARSLFDDAFRLLSSSSGGGGGSPLRRLTRVMCGMGRAHTTTTTSTPREKEEEDEQEEDEEDFAKRLAREELRGAR